MSSLCILKRVRVSAVDSRKIVYHCQIADAHLNKNVMKKRVIKLGAYRHLGKDS